MADLQARFAQLLGSIETKVEQIKPENPDALDDKENQQEEKTATTNQPECEMDPARLKTRQRQIEIGKNSSSYEKFISKYPKRNMRPKKGPWTPNKYQKCSSRSWAGQIKKWRKLLHIHSDDKSEQDDYTTEIDQ